MRLRGLLLMLGLATTGCRDSTAPLSGDLIGFWTASQRNSDGTVYQSILSLDPAGTFTREWRDYASGPVNGLGALTAYIITDGTFSVRGDSVFMRATTVRNWDRDFNGGAVTITPVTTGVGPFGYGGARYEARRDSLILHFISYPADAPVETSEAFARTYLAVSVTR